MSDPTGQGTTPEKPTFSGPEGYASRTLSIQQNGVDIPADEKILSIPQVVKGVTVGTFAPRNPDGLKTSYVLPPNVSQPKPRRVGAEVRNPEMEENAKLGKLLKEEGFMVDPDDGSVVIPTDYIFEEELRALVPLSQEFAVLKYEIRKIQDRITDAPLAASLLTLVEEIETFIEKTKKEPSEEKLNELQDKLQELTEKKEKAAALISAETDEEKELQAKILKLTAKVNKLVQHGRALENDIADQNFLKIFKEQRESVERALIELVDNLDEVKRKSLEQDVAYYERSIENAETFIAQNPKPAAAPATPAAPPQPLLREFAGWPGSQIYYRKAAKGQPAGLYSTKKADLLDEQEAWTHEKAAFDAIFRTYLDFIKSLTLEERQLVRPLIELKNELIEAIKKEDLSEVGALREELEKTTAVFKEKIEMLHTISHLVESFVKEKESAKKLPEGLKKNLERTEGKVAAALREAETGATNGTFAKRDIEGLANAIEAYKKEIEYYKENAYKPIRQDPTLLDTKVHGAWVPQRDGTKKLTGILRPVIATDTNRNQKIHRIGSGGTADNANNDPTIGEYAAELEAKKANENSVALNEQDFADWPELRATGHVPGDTIDKQAFGKVQTDAKYLRMLERNENAFLSLYTAQSVDPDTHDVVYTSTETLRKHPEREIIKTVLWERKGIQVIDPTRKEQKVADSKEKERERLSRTKLGMTYNPTRDLEKGLWRSLPDKNTTRISNFGGMVTNAKRRPVIMATPVGNEPEPQVVQKPPLTPEEKKKEREAFWKIRDIINARENWFTKNPRNVHKGRLDWRLIGIGAIAAAAAAGGYYATRAGTQGPAISAGVGEKAPTSATEKFPDWRGWFADKQFLSDFATMSNEQFLMKYAYHSADPNKPSAVSDVLKMDGYKILNEPGPCYGLDDERRNELCGVLIKMEALSSSVDAPFEEMLRAEGKQFNASADRGFTPNVTIEKRMEELRAKIAAADKRTGI